MVPNVFQHRSILEWTQIFIPNRVIPALCIKIKTLLRGGSYIPRYYVYKISVKFKIFTHPMHNESRKFLLIELSHLHTTSSRKLHYFLTSKLSHSNKLRNKGNLCSADRTLGKRVKKWEAWYDIYYVEGKREEKGENLKEFGVLLETLQFRNNPMFTSFISWQRLHSSSSSSSVFFIHRRRRFRRHDYRGHSCSRKKEKKNPSPFFFSFSISD